MQKSDFKKGQKVYLRILERSDAARYVDDDAWENDPESHLLEREVASIGNKYISVGKEFNGTICDITKFDIDNDFKQANKYGSADYALHLTKQDAFDEIERGKLLHQIKMIFSGFRKPKFTLDQLRRIYAIIEEANN